MQDLVGDAGCEGGNPLLNMVNQFMQDPTGKHRYELGQRMEPQPGFGDMYERTLPEGVSPHQLMREHAGVERFFDRPEGLAFDELDPDLDSFTAEFNAREEPAGHFDRTLRGPAPVPTHVKDQQLHHLFKSFIHGSQSHQGMGPVERMGLNLSGIEKEKIRNRMGIMAHHFAPGPVHEEFVQEQLGSLFHSLEINERAAHRPVGHEQDWGEEFAAREARGKEVVPERWAREFEVSHARERPWEEEFQNFDEGQFRGLQSAWRDTQGERWAEELQEQETGSSELERKIAYSRYLDSLTEEQAQAELQGLSRRISSMAGDPRLQSSKFLQLMARLGDGRVVVEGNKLVESDAESTSTSGSLAPLASSSETATHSGADLLNEWLEEYEDFEPPPLRGWDFSDFNNDPELQAMFRPQAHPDDLTGLFGDNSMWGYLRPYEFEPENKFLGHPDPLAKGKELFANGEISDAILALEAAARRDGTQSEIWRRLGEAHAENDRDDRAIAALLRALRNDPGDLDALLALGVSCTNDSYKDQAMHVLRSWLTHHPRYKEHEPEWARQVGIEQDDEELHGKVTDMFINAARLSPHDPDPDVQIALGLLFNISGEFDKAVDCFRTALQKRPDDYLLWNKLGATLANSNHSKEALAPYYKSLQLKPTYTRARANLGISYLNQDMYAEAATQFLACLAIQPAARHIWISLQTVFSRMGRDDLLEKTLSYDVEKFRQDFNF